ncbi:MAG: nucleotide exchange factor GrpE [Candidatus Aminicenantes bacterium]|nr:nucleotide exchange factor GrpE [Candidatus Aminicenantes bacterium]
MTKKIKIESAGNKKKEQPATKKENSKDKEIKYKALKDKLKTCEAEIKFFKKEHKELKGENKELKGKYLRKAAEMENLRKRVTREKTEFYQYALAEFIKELFVVLDNFERALESNEDGKNLRQGIEMIYKQYTDLLMKQGIKAIETREKKFDPYLHHAFITEESENVDEPQIIEELQRGYTLYDRLLRPALVKVLIPKKKDN